MRKAFSSALFTVIAIVMFVVMFGGVAAADTTHGKAPPGQSIVLVDNTGYPISIEIDANTAGFVGATSTVGPTGAISSIVGIPSTGAGMNYTATSAIYDGRNMDLAISATAASTSEARRSLRGTGKIISGLTTRELVSERARTVSLGDDVGDRP